jgi:Glycosyltransferase family 87
MNQPDPRRAVDGSAPSGQAGSSGSWLAAPRTRRLSVAALLGIAVGFAIFVGTSEGLRTVHGGRLGGDFPAFYSAGRILNAGEARLLYDQATQRRTQQGLFPSGESGWLPFAYPPYVAVVYRPFAALPFVTAYVVYTLAMVGCCAGAVFFLSRLAPWCAGNRAFWLAAVLTFYPLFRAVVGGQNTAISLLCAAGVTFALQRGRYTQCGVWLGLWLFKPQFAAVVTGAIVVAGYGAVLPGLLLTAAVTYGVGAIVSGPEWPLTWYRDGVVPFLPANLSFDGHHALSLRELTAQLGHPGLALPASALLLALGVVAIRRSRPPALPLVAGATCVALLVSPHAMYYDGGLALLAVVAVSQGRPFLTLALLSTALLFIPVGPQAPFSALPAASALLCGLGIASLRTSPEDAAGTEDRRRRRGEANLLHRREAFDGAMLPQRPH